MSKFGYAYEIIWRNLIDLRRNIKTNLNFGSFRLSLKVESIFYSMGMNLTWDSNAQLTLTNWNLLSDIDMQKLITWNGVIVFKSIKPDRLLRNQVNLSLIKFKTYRFLNSRDPKPPNLCQWLWFPILNSNKTVKRGKSFWTLQFTCPRITSFCALELKMSIFICGGWSNLNYPVQNLKIDTFLEAFQQLVLHSVNKSSRKARLFSKQ